MSRYQEDFEVDGRHHGILIKDDGKYQIWRGGSALHSGVDTIEEARDLLKQYCISALEAAKAGYEDRIAQIKPELRELYLNPAGMLHFLTAYKEPEDENGQHTNNTD